MRSVSLGLGRGSGSRAVCNVRWVVPARRGVYRVSYGLRRESVLTRRMRCPVGCPCVWRLKYGELTCI